MIWEISTVKNPRDSESPKSLPTNMNSSIREIPVTISAFIIGICVTDIMIFLGILRLIAVMPTAAAVPSTVEIKAEDTAIIKVCCSALIIAVSDVSPAYQRVEKPFITQTLPLPLNEKITMTATGA